MHPQSLIEAPLTLLLLPTVQRLRHAFHDKALFWRAHNYPQSGYFSYYFPMNRAPRNVVEACACPCG